MSRPKLILLNGFAAAGKTTIAKRYITEHSLALALEADALVDNIGGWHKHEAEVRRLTFATTKAILRAYLPSGHDVVLPYLMTDAAEAAAFEAIAAACQAEYYEVLLHSDRDAAIARLLRRGRWGEATSPPLTEQDLPEINKLYDRMSAALAARPPQLTIRLAGRSPAETYEELLRGVRVAEK